MQARTHKKQQCQLIKPTQETKCPEASSHKATHRRNKSRTSASDWLIIETKSCFYQNISPYVVNKRTKGSVAHLKLFALSKSMVIILNTETYGYLNRYSLKKALISVPYSNLVGMEFCFN